MQLHEHLIYSWKSFVASQRLFSKLYFQLFQTFP